MLRDVLRRRPIRGSEVEGDAGGGGASPVVVDVAAGQHGRRPRAGPQSAQAAAFLRLVFLRVAFLRVAFLPVVFLPAFFLVAFFLRAGLPVPGK